MIIGFWLYHLGLLYLRNVSLNIRVGEVDPTSPILVTGKGTKNADERNYSFANFFFRNQDTAQPFFSAT